MQVNPATESVVGYVAAGGKVDVDRAVAEAHAAFVSGVWSRTSGAHRAAVLRRVAEKVTADSDSLLPCPLHIPRFARLLSDAFAAPTLTSHVVHRSLIRLATLRVVVSCVHRLIAKPPATACHTPL